MLNNKEETYDRYAPWVEKYRGLENVQADERKHGDMVTEIIQKLKKKK